MKLLSRYAVFFCIILERSDGRFLDIQVKIAMAAMVNTTLTMMIFMDILDVFVMFSLVRNVRKVVRARARKAPIPEYESITIFSGFTSSFPFT